MLSFARLLKSVKYFAVCSALCFAAPNRVIIYDQTKTKPFVFSALQPVFVFGALQALSTKIHLWLLILLFKLSLQNLHDYEANLFYPDVSHAKSLVCYQCNSSSTDLLPICDVQVFKYSKPEDKIQRLFVCPPHKRSFCFLEVFQFSFKEVRKTKRGCAHSKDERNIQLKPGCVRLSQDRTLCFCNTHKCNKREQVKVSKILIFSVIVAQVL